MALTVDSADRISNKTIPTDPADKTLMNADNVMLILDKILNGEYRIKSKVYATGSEMRAVTGEPGERVYCTEEDTYYAWKTTSGSWEVDA